MAIIKKSVIKSQFMIEEMTHCNSMQNIKLYLTSYSYTIYLIEEIYLLVISYITSFSSITIIMVLYCLLLIAFLLKHTMLLLTLITINEDTWISQWQLLPRKMRSIDRCYAFADISVL